MSVLVFITITLIAAILIPFLKVKWMGVVIISAIAINALFSGYFAVQTLCGNTFDIYLSGSLVTGPIHLKMDALSGWFILIISFVFLTGGLYGISYLKAYRERKKSITLHGISFTLCYTALILLCVIQNSIVFLIAWEIMALSAFVLVIFEHEKTTTIKAGINYLIQSHVGILFLTLGFIWMAIKTGSYDFDAITTFTASHSNAESVALFLCFFIGFAIKAGFVPFHTWLPHAHPAAPAHISGIMSGVIIKIGIFGILRMLTVVKTDYASIGYFLLIISAISGLYGVMLAIIQHNLKKLLAYHSIENIGIIGLGISIGCIGMGHNNVIIASIGFAGALLHTLNHALFKSLLFFTSGNVYQAVHTINIESLGGIIKKMPQTAILFLIAAIAICGIPPFNGFISEFVIYTGLYQLLQNSSVVLLILIIFSVLALVLIGGLALLCFTKAFGMVFLGTERSKLPDNIKETRFLQLLPLYLITFLIVMIGIFPNSFLSFLSKPIVLLTNNQSVNLFPLQGTTNDALQYISRAAWGLILLVLLIFFLRKLVTRKRKIETLTTWGCGYVASSPKLQYTASSFVRTYRKLYGSLLLTIKKEKEIKGVFPSKGLYETHPYDNIEKWLVDKPIKAYKSFLGRFVFLQSGRLQVSILYGIIFIFLVISIPLIYQKIILFIDFLKQL
jgi:formate hydrogenlyase subunit 3/multisubunit Na+/H+ antiporter MnhD subunit